MKMGTSSDIRMWSGRPGVLWVEALGPERKEKLVFGTFTRDLLKLSDWLRECSVRQVARLEALGFRISVEPLAQTA